MTIAIDLDRSVDDRSLSREEREARGRDRERATLRGVRVTNQCDVDVGLVRRQIAAITYAPRSAVVVVAIPSNELIRRSEAHRLLWHDVEGRLRDDAYAKCSSIVEDDGPCLEPLSTLLPTLL